MKPYYTDETVTLWHGKNLEALPHIADGSIDCVVTSPPYFGLRDYGVEGQYGSEETPAEFVANLVATFREIRRVLAGDGTAWLNLGDSYYSGRGAPTGADQKNPARRGFVRPLDKPGQSWATPKNLLGIPWRTAFALQDDGWVLRNAIVWHKPNAMPESVTDRLSQRYEVLFMFSKSRRYHFDLDPIRSEYSERVQERQSYAGRDIPTNSWSDDAGRGDSNPGRGILGFGHRGANPSGRNPGDVWEIPTVPFPGSHFAVFPPEIPRRCILAGCKPGGTVLDPFHGSGTTGMVAQRLGRKYVGIELKAEYIDLSLRTRLADGALPFETEGAS